MGGRSGGGPVSQGAGVAGTGVLGGRSDLLPREVGGGGRYDTYTPSHSVGMYRQTEFNILATPAPNYQFCSDIVTFGL